MRFAFADTDPYRCATHNKGIMNGVSAAALALGQDTRAIEAGAHSYAARSGRYRSLTTYEKDENGNLVGHDRNADGGGIDRRRVCRASSRESMCENSGSKERNRTRGSYGFARAGAESGCFAEHFPQKGSSAAT